MFFGIVGAVAKNRVITSVNEIFKDLAVMDLGGGGFGFVDELAFGVLLPWW